MSLHEAKSVMQTQSLYKSALLECEKVQKTGDGRQSGSGEKWKLAKVAVAVDGEICKTRQRQMGDGNAFCFAQLWRWANLKCPRILEHCFWNSSCAGLSHLGIIIS